MNPREILGQGAIEWTVKGTETDFEFHPKPENQ